MPSPRPSPSSSLLPVVVVVYRSSPFIHSQLTANVSICWELNGLLTYARLFFFFLSLPSVSSARVDMTMMMSQPNKLLLPSRHLSISIYLLFLHLLEWRISRLFKTLWHRSSVWISIPIVIRLSIDRTRAIGGPSQDHKPQHSLPGAYFKPLIIKRHKRQSCQVGPWNEFTQKRLI